MGVEAVIDAACLQLGVSLEQLVGRARHPDIVQAREVACMLLRDVRPGVILDSQPSYPEIARAMSRPNHSSIVTAHQRGLAHASARAHARQVCDRLGIPHSHRPAWMVGQGDLA